MKYSLSDRAQADLIGIYTYTVINFGETQAERYLGGLYDSFERLLDNPKLGKPARKNTRCYIYKSHYVIYHIDGDTIKILRVIHTRMELP